MTSAPSPVRTYLDALEPDRRATVEAARDLVLEHLPEGYVEAVEWGMLAYLVPMERSGPTYNGKPLMYAALASQKRHVSLYLTSVYADPDHLATFRERFVATGRRLDMGKSCVRFRTIDDLPLELIGETIAATTVDEYLALVAAVRD